MSRARQRSTVHTVADNLEQAVEDLRRDWAQERRPRWAIDTGTPATQPLDAEHEPAAPAELRNTLRRARLRVERAALAALVPPDPYGRLFDAHRRAGALRQELDDLEHGAGRYQHTELGAAARAHREARDRRALAERVLGDPNLGWWTRHAWRRQLAAAQDIEEQLRARWDKLAEPERRPLAHALHAAEHETTALQRQADEHRRWTRSHANVISRINSIDHELGERPERLTLEPIHVGLDVAIQPSREGISIEL